jgi:hypothetical protein
VDVFIKMELWDKATSSQDNKSVDKDLMPILVSITRS